MCSQRLYKLLKSDRRVQVIKACNTKAVYTLVTRSFFHFPGVWGGTVHAKPCRCRNLFSTLLGTLPAARRYAHFADLFPHVSGSNLWFDPADDEILGQDGTRRGLCTISTLSFKDSHCDRAGLFEYRYFGSAYWKNIRVFRGSFYSA